MPYPPSQPWIVWKFGGTSVATADKIINVCNLISAAINSDIHGHPPTGHLLGTDFDEWLAKEQSLSDFNLAVVVSAFHGVTDSLHDACRLASQRQQPTSEYLTAKSFKSSFGTLPCQLFPSEIPSTNLIRPTWNVKSTGTGTPRSTTTYVHVMRKIEEIHVNILGELLAKGVLSDQDVAAFLHGFEKDRHDIFSILGSMALIQNTPLEIVESVASFGELWSSQIVYLVVSNLMGSQNALQISHANDKAEVATSPSRSQLIRESFIWGKLSSPALHKILSSHLDANFLPGSVTSRSKVSQDAGEMLETIEPQAMTRIASPSCSVSPRSPEIHASNPRPAPQSSSFASDNLMDSDKMRLSSTSSKDMRPSDSVHHTVHRLNSFKANSPKAPPSAFSDATKFDQRKTREFCQFCCLQPSAIQWKSADHCCNNDVVWLDARKVLYVRKTVSQNNRVSEKGSQWCQETDQQLVVNMPMCKERLTTWLAAHPWCRICITPGYICSQENGCPTTLQRNGSDFSGSIYAALLKARLYTVWTDVKGVFSADPKQVRTARRLPYITYQEAIELAFFGAQVLHPLTIQPCIQTRIPVILRSSLHPNENGTLIFDTLPKSSECQCPCRAFVASEQMCMLNISGTCVPSICSRFFVAMQEAHCPITMITQASSKYSLSCTIPYQHRDHARETIETTFYKEFHSDKSIQLDIHPSCSLVCAIGEHMSGNVGILGELTTALGRAGVNIKAVAQGSSEYNITFVIDHKFAIKGLRVMHDAVIKLDPEESGENTGNVIMQPGVPPISPGNAFGFAKKHPLSGVCIVLLISGTQKPVSLIRAFTNRQYKVQVLGWTNGDTFKLFNEKEGSLLADTCDQISKFVDETSFLLAVDCRTSLRTRSQAQFLKHWRSLQAPIVNVSQLPHMALFSIMHAERFRRDMNCEI